jgi:hypothetical protein
MKASICGSVPMVTNNPEGPLEEAWCRKEDYSALRASPSGRPAADQIGCAEHDQDTDEDAQPEIVTDCEPSPSS